MEGGASRWIPYRTRRGQNVQGWRQAAPICGSIRRKGLHLGSRSLLQ